VNAPTSTFVARFERDGFVLVPDLFADAELDALALAVDAGVRARDRGSDQAGGRLEAQLGLAINLWEDRPDVRRWTFDQRVAQIAAQLLGVARLRLFIDQALYKPAGAPGTDRHQDITRLPIDGARTLTAWIPFDGATASSGTLAYVPGTHRLRAASYYDQLFGLTWSPAEQRALQRDPVVVEVPRGAVLFHHAQTFHCSLANHTQRVRRCFAMIYFADGSVRVSSFPHLSVDRAGIAVGDVVDGDATPLVYPLAEGTYPAPPPPLLDPPRDWPGSSTHH
jgi:ectoine hydroxylase-related dioxygenase (phytanoyl-CoA dioxygenase family)